MKTALATVLLLFAASLPPPAHAACADTDKACLLKALRAHPVRTLGHWAPQLAKPVVERLGPAPAGLVEYLGLDNRLNGFPERPAASRLTDDFLADVRGAVADLPPVVRKLLGGTFAGVYFVDDLGGTGYTDLYFDVPDQPAGAYIVLDAKVLGKFTANAWATWKENTPFKPQPGWKLEARIEEAASDDRRGAIRYILLHELGHVLAASRPIHPRWDEPPKASPVGRRLPYFDLSWTIDRAADKYVSRFEREFPLRASVVYYLGAKLEAKDMPAAYESLDRTNFPTLYGSTGPGDDFAEAFASYVHAVLMKRPWEIVISKDGKAVKTYRPCWDDPRCIEKREILETLLR